MAAPIRNPFRLFAMFLNSAAFYLFRIPTPPKDRFDLLYSLKKDPWHYHSSTYESDKYKDTLSLLAGASYGTVLEMGCSVGVFTAQLAPLCKNLIAADASSVALERTRVHCKEFPYITFKCMDLFNDALDEKFDLIVCSEVLYYLDDYNKIKEMMHKMADWLLPDGKVLLAHMRRKKEDGVGFGRSLLGFPSMGAVSVHGIFKEESAPFEIVSEIIKDLYIVSVFKKRNL